MKKLLTAFTFSLAVIVALPFNSIAIDPENKIASNTPAKEADARAMQLVQRLEEIKGMDKSEMSRVEKKELRKEVKEIRKEMKASKNGVYLSVGAIIIIILLLILLL